MLQQCKRRLKLVGLLNEARKTSFGIFLRSGSFPQFLFPLAVLTLIKYFFFFFLREYLAIQDQ